MKIVFQSDIDKDIRYELPAEEGAEERMRDIVAKAQAENPGDVRYFVGTFSKVDDTPVTEAVVIEKLGVP